MNYMREGGWAMWAMLITALFVAGWAAARPKEARSRALAKGSVVILMEGMLGMATGMIAVSSKYELFPDKTAAVAQGLGELANNGTFAAVLFTVVGVASLATEPRPKQG
jgi:hypothetical protein